jgi:glycosyltransferase involved in cell wall biosynthesis
MKVSIIIPVYNAEKYLRECIDSALNQTYQDLEVIAVDDGSTDGSLELLKKYSDKITLISKENGGVASAMNAGMKIAKGEWIKQLDCDDVLHHDAVEELVSAARNLKGEVKNYVLYSNQEVINFKGGLIYERICPDYNHLSGFDLNVILLDHMSVFPTTTLINKSAFLEYGFYDESLPLTSDYDLLLRFCFLHGCRPHLIPKILSKYRIHQNQTSFRNLKNGRAAQDRIRGKILYKLDPVERQKYVKALKQYKFSRPLTTKTRGMIFSSMVKIFPNSTVYRIVETYHNMKLTNLRKRNIMPMST